MAPGIITAKEEVPEHPTSVRLSQAMVDDIAAIADETNRSRNEVIVQLLRYALEAHHKDAGRKAKK